MSNDTKVTTFLTPKTATEAFEIANNLSTSSFIPSALKGKPADIVVAMAYGAELGLPPLQSLQNIAVINGRPSLWGDAVRALVLNSHDLVELSEWDENGTFYCKIVRKTRAGGEMTIQKSFSDEDAKAAGLAGKQGPWKQYPKRMKQMRAFGFAARDAYADRFRGFITREEAEDLPKEKDVTPPAGKANGSTLGSIIEQASKIDDEPAPQQTPEPEFQGESVDTLTGEVMEPETSKFDMLCVKAKTAPNIIAFNAVKDEVKKAHTNGEITDAQGNDIKKIMTATNKRLKEEALNEPLDF